MQNNLFTREDTRCVKAIAAIMMMAHHIFAFADRIPTGFAYSVSSEASAFLLEFGRFSKLCVSLFLFLGGYGLYMQMKPSPDSSRKSSFHTTIVRQYAQYWKVFIVFVPIALLFFSNQPEYCKDVAICTAYSTPTLKEIVSNFLGWTSKYNREWWFFRAYLCASFTGYIYI